VNRLLSERFVVPVSILLLSVLVLTIMRVVLLLGVLERHRLLLPVAAPVCRAAVLRGAASCHCRVVPSRAVAAVMLAGRRLFLHATRHHHLGTQAHEEASQGARSAPRSRAVTRTSTGLTDAPKVVPIPDVLLSTILPPIDTNRELRYPVDTATARKCIKMLLGHRERLH
jgi:hypothetical protein